MAQLQLHYQVQGSPQNSALIIVPGFFASSRNWRAIASALAQDFYVYTLDMRNHGDSPQAEPMDYPSMAQDVVDFIAQQQLTTVSLLGHSMGGKVSLWLALHYPQLLHRLIIVDIAPISYVHSFSTIIDALCALPLSELSSRKQADEWLSHTIGHSSMRQFLLQNLILHQGQYCWRLNLAIFKRAAATISAFPPTNTQPFNKPVLVLAGEHSSLVCPEAFIPLFPQATLQTLANAGHWMHVDAPQAFLNAVRSHLLTTG